MYHISDTQVYFKLMYHIGDTQVYFKPTPGHPFATAGDPVLLVITYIHQAMYL